MKNWLCTMILMLVFLLPGPFLHASVLKERQQVQLLIKLLAESHKVYAESWRVLFASKSSPLSPMKMLAEKLQKEMQINKPTKAAAKARPALFSLEVTELSEANFKKRQLKFVFRPEDFRAAFGDALALLNRRATCELSYDRQDRLQLMKCQGLGRGLTKVQHIEFHEFNYQRNNQQMLEVKADQYENLLKKMLCTSTEPCLQMKVPLAGKIKIIENRIFKEEAPLPMPVITPPMETPANTLPQQQMPPQPPELAPNLAPSPQQSSPQAEQEAGLQGEQEGNLQESQIEDPPQLNTQEHLPDPAIERNVEQNVEQNTKEQYEKSKRRPNNPQIPVERNR